MVLHDIRCPSCESEEHNVRVDPSDFPLCLVCGTRMRFIPRGFRTDVYGSPRYSEAAGCEVRSSRDRDRIMREAGFEPCGDRVGGAINQEHMNLGKSFSYGGQSVRKTLVREK